MFGGKHNRQDSDFMVKPHGFAIRYRKQYWKHGSLEIRANTHNLLGIGAPKMWSISPGHIIASYAPEIGSALPTISGAMPRKKIASILDGVSPKHLRSER